MTFREFNRTFPIYSKVQVFRLKQGLKLSNDVIPLCYDEVLEYGSVRLKKDVIPSFYEKVVECGSLTLDRYLDNIMDEYGRPGFEEILDKEVVGLSANCDTLNILIS